MNKAILWIGTLSDLDEAHPTTTIPHMWQVTSQVMSHEIVFGVMNFPTRSGMAGRIDSVALLVLARL